MAAIEFTQFLMPDGRQKTVTIDRPDEIARKAQAIIDQGYRFECEILTTGDISLTITDDDEDADIELVENGPDVPAAVDRLMERFSNELHNRAEAAWERQQEALRDSGGPDDSSYRAAMKDAGRGHLLR